MRRLSFAALIFASFAALPARAEDKDRSAAEQKTLALLKSLGAAVQVNDKDDKKPIIGVTLRDTRLMSVEDFLLALKVFPDLTSLDLSLCPLRGVDLKPLGELTKLKELSLYGTGVDDSALTAIKGLKNLRVLNLSYTKTTDAALAELKELPALEQLYLAGSKDAGPFITDAGVGHLAGLKNLQKLTLSGPAITDKSVPTLAGLSKLTEISLVKTEVTAAGIAELRKALPMTTKVRTSGR